MKAQLVQTPEQVDMEQLTDLLHQLDPTGEPPTGDNVAKCVADKGSFLIIALSEEGVWCGMVTVIICTTVKNRKALIEDFVVREEFRRQGIGRLLIKAALDCAAEQDAEYCDLTSRPERVAANLFYQSYGFAKRDTNCYRINLKTK